MTEQNNIIPSVVNQLSKMTTVEIAEYIVELKSFVQNIENFSKRRWMIPNQSAARNLRNEVLRFEHNNQMAVECSWITTSLLTAISQDIINSAINESDIQKYFAANIGDFIPGGKLVKRTANGNNIPDFFVEIEGEVCVGEIKLDRFIGSSKKQLRRYMDFYSSPHGFAVASELVVALDTDMTFIKIDKASIQDVIDVSNIVEGG